MAKNFDEAFRNLQNKLTALQRDALQIVQVMSERHYRDSFRDGGFTDQTLQRWKPLKNSSRSPLTLTGHLKGSIRSQIIGNGVHVFSDAEYAGYQNYGTQHIPARKFIGFSKTLNSQIRDRILLQAKKIFY
ncbi:MAG: hypothetical protein JSS79_05300 [Bacteroidetes bacterium]|nr:hypothetical protein [Bacteroidota bacterium]